MLGHDSLGRWALGQLPSAETGAAVAPGAILPLTLTLVAGAASGEGQIVVIGGGGRVPWDAVAPGAVLHLRLSLVPGRVAADSAPRGAALRVGARFAAGNATGEGQTEYDNAVALLLAA